MALSRLNHCQQLLTNSHLHIHTSPCLRLFISFILIVSMCTDFIQSVQHVSGSDQLGGLDSYKISWKGSPNDQNKDYVDKDDDDVIHIATKDNEKYMCIVPSTGHLNFDTSAKNSSTEDGEPKNPIQILEPLLKRNLCSYKFEVFWIYELCHGKYLRQYHEETTKYKSKVTQEYYLGKMDLEQIKDHEEVYLRQKEERARTNEPKPTILVNGHHKPYITFNMTSGTKCDLTNKSRVSRIVYVCNEEPSLELYSIKEISTCEYEAIVLSPTLCQHEDFKVDTNTLHEIKCYSLDGSPVRPKKTIEYEEKSLDETDGSTDAKRNGHKRMSKAYLQGRTLIIDMDSILS